MARKRFTEDEEKLIGSLFLAMDPCFTVAFDDNPGGTEFLVRTILGRDDICIRDVHAQKRITNIGRHSFIFDILATEDDGSLIDIEMQYARENRDEERGRMAFYAAALTQLALRPGEMYREGRKVIVIFIMEYDIPGNGQAVYTYHYSEDRGMDEMLESPMLVLANASYRDNIESLISMYSDLHENDLERVRCPEIRECLGLLKGRNAMGQQSREGDE